MILLLIITALGAASRTPPQPARPASPDGPELLDRTVILRPGVASDVAILRVKVPAGFRWAPGMGLVDPEPGSPRVAFEYAGETTEANGRTLFFAATFKSIPLVYSQTRTLLLLPGTDTKYSVTNAVADDKGAAFAGIPEAWDGREPLRLSIATDATPMTRLSLAAASISEVVSRSTIPISAFCLSRVPEGNCGPVDIGPRSAVIAYLRYTGEDRPGTYSGKLTFSSIENPRGKDVAVTITISSWPRRALGMFLVILGVAAAWVVRSWVTNRVARDEALLPALLYVRRTQALQTKLEAVKIVTPALELSVQVLLEDLDPVELERKRLIPPARPAVAPSAVRTTEYNLLLDRVQVQLRLLTLFIEEGVVKAAAIGGPEAAKTIALLDEKYSPQLEPLTAARLIEQFLAALRPRQGPGIERSTGGAQATPARLRVEIHRLNDLAWFAILVATAAGAIAVLVLNRPTFGSPVDLINCWLAGFGIPTATASLAGRAGSPSTSPSTGHPFTGNA